VVGEILTIAIKAKSMFANIQQPLRKKEFPRLLMEYPAVKNPIFSGLFSHD